MVLIIVEYVSCFFMLLEYKIVKQNQGLINRISQAQKSIHSRSLSQNNSKQKFISITQNLKAMYNINRNSRCKKIQQENNKMFSRLVNTSSTLSRKSWVKADENNKQYKMNISRTKCKLYFYNFRC